MQDLIWIAAMPALVAASLGYIRLADLACSHEHPSTRQ